MQEKAPVDIRPEAVPPSRPARPPDNIPRGIACVLATQLRDASGRRTVWGQQHDALTLAPCAARNFEPTSACSLESAGLVEFLMSLPRPTAEVRAAIDGAMAWFAANARHGVAWDRRAEQGSGLAARAGAPDLWARLYEIKTGLPVFGDRDRSVHYDVTEISAERRQGYGWYNSRPADLPERYAQWQRRTAP